MNNKLNINCSDIHVYAIVFEACRSHIILSSICPNNCKLLLQKIQFKKSQNLPWNRAVKTLYCNYNIYRAFKGVSYSAAWKIEDSVTYKITYKFSTKKKQGIRNEQLDYIPVVRKLQKCHCMLLEKPLKARCSWYTAHSVTVLRGVVSKHFVHVQLSKYVSEV